MVEAVAEGELEAVQRFVAWCHTGPPMASVDDVEETWEESVGLFKRFEARETE